ncbi:MAG: hypothetical protein ACRDPG_13950 [Nocardioidaceae bacterium]
MRAVPQSVLGALAACALAGICCACSPGAVAPTKPAPSPPSQSSSSVPTHSTQQDMRAHGFVAPWDRPLPPARSGGHLRPGSDPNVLPGDLLIADKLNNRLIIVDPRGRIRWRFPGKGGLRSGQPFLIPDDAFFTPDGRHIIATEEDDFVIRVIDVVRQAIIYHYGKPGVSGDGRNRVWNPDDAIMLPNHDIVTADIKNERLLLIREGRHDYLRHWGDVNHGYHQPPRYYGSPNGMFPAGHGRFLVTEIRGDWVDEIDLHGHVFWSVHPPGVTYPSDTNKIGPDRYLTVDYSSPGQIVIFDQHGKTLWRYTGTPRQPLNHPSLALPLPNGDIVCNDDWNHRVIVVDPHTDKIVWQYGHYGVPGHKPGYLDNPDGIDLAPPYSLIDTTLHPH